MKIAIVIPAHNEEDTIADCLTSLQLAIKQLPQAVSAYLLVVLDSCTDNTEAIVDGLGVNYITCDYQCVGKVRDLGVRQAIEAGASWIACTDADSYVPAEWLTEQLHHLREGQSQNNQSQNNQAPTKQADMICGVVDVDSWAHLHQQTQEKYRAHYQDKMGHRHIHGANLSFGRDAYLAVGGFPAIACHEDVTLVENFKANGYHIIWSNRVRVITSSRLQARAKEGFAHFLNNLQNSI